MHKITFLLLILVVSAVLAACQQQEGDRCEVTSDCEDGLVCCIPAGTQEGTCQYEENCQNQ